MAQMCQKKNWLWHLLAWSFIFLTNCKLIYGDPTFWGEIFLDPCRKLHGSGPFLSLMLSFASTHTCESRLTLLLSLVAWHKEDLSFPTHLENEEKIKKTQRAVFLFNGEKTLSVTSAIRITVGTHSPCCLDFPLVLRHWLYVCA